MPIPPVAILFDSFLRELSDGKDYKLADITEGLASKFNLSPEEKRALLPSGKDQIFNNRLGWTRTYLKKAGLISYSTWGVFRITKEGQTAIGSTKPGGIDLAFLKQYPSFTSFYSPNASISAISPPQSSAQNHEAEQADPEGSIEANVSKLRAQISAELLARVKAVSPQAFERLVVQMICRLGYGGSERDAGEAIGRTGDGGIDGTIREDRLGLDVIYLQAKRWDSVVGRPVVQAFVGALHGKNARRGVMITTSTFTKEAQEYVNKCSDKVILIDGVRLIDLMFEYNLGVVVKRTYEIKDIDLTYFEQFQ